MAARALIAALLALALGGCALNAPVPEFPRDAAAYAERARVVGDDLDTHVLVQVTSPFTAGGRTDIDVLRARLVGRINRSTLQQDVIVAVDALHSAGDWLFPFSATYLGLDGVAVVGRAFGRGQGDVQCGARALSCDYQETAFFSVGRDELTVIANEPKTRHTGAWRVRFHTRRGNLDPEVPVLMIDGLLRRMSQEADRLRTRR